MHKKKMLKSFDSLAWLMQIILFLTLGLLVFPSEIIPVMGIGLIISAFIILIFGQLVFLLVWFPLNYKTAPNFLFRGLVFEEQFPLFLQPTRYSPALKKPI